MLRRARLLNAMANPARLEILALISEQEFPVRELATALGLSQSALSQHLAKLRGSQLVTTRRDAQTIYYSTNSEAVKTILSALEEIFAGVERENSEAGSVPATTTPHLHD